MTVQEGHEPSLQPPASSRRVPEALEPTASREVTSSSSPVSSGAGSSPSASHGTPGLAGTSTLPVRTREAADPAQPRPEDRPIETEIIKRCYFESKFVIIGSIMNTALHKLRHEIQTL